MITKETTKIGYNLRIWYNWHKTTTVNHQPCLTLSYPQGTTLHIFYFITICKNASPFSQDRSWQLTNLLYHVLRVDYYFCIATKIFLLQLKILSFPTSLSSTHVFPGTPPCTDIIASFWVMWVKTQDMKLTHLCFQLIMVSFYPYLFISIHGKTLLIFMLLLTHLIMPINNVITQTIFVVLFTSGSLLTWGKPLDALSGISPRYLSPTYSQFTISPFFCRHHMMTDYAFFSLGSDRWGKDLTPLWGCLTFCSPLQQFHIPSITQSELSSLTSLKAWGEKQKVHHDIAYLLVLAEEETTGDRRYGLSTVWVNPCQARVCSMEEVDRELTAWVSSGPDWPYALVQLNKDTHHVPLPKKGNLGVLPQGEADKTACRRINQLEVCQLLASGLQVAYPVGLNGCKDPIIISLPKSLASGISLTGGKSVYQEINIPQPMAKELDWKALPLGGCSTIIISSLLKTTPPKLEREVSMTMEVRSLLSWAILGTSGHRPGNSTPKRPNPVVILTPPPHKLKDLPKLVDTSSQVSAQDDVEMVDASLGEVPTTISPIAVAPRSRSNTPPADVGLLWEKANKALEELLATKSSIDAHRQKAVQELGMDHCLNDSKTAESIKEAKGLCTCNIQEAETVCSVATREAETQGASQAESLHRWHAKVIKCLEEQVIQEEGKSQIDFLSPCQAALNPSPGGLRGALVASYHILMGKAPTSHPFSLSQGATLPSNHLLQQLLLGWHLSIPPGPKGNYTPLTLWMACLWAGPGPKQLQKGPLTPNGKRSYLGTRYSSRATQRCSAGTLA